MLEKASDYLFVSNAADCGITGDIFPVRAAAGRSLNLKREDAAYLVEAYLEYLSTQQWTTSSNKVYPTIGAYTFKTILENLQRTFHNSCIEKDFVPTPHEWVYNSSDLPYNFIGLYPEAMISDEIITEAEKVALVSKRPLKQRGILSKAFALLARTNVQQVPQGRFTIADFYSVSYDETRRTFTTSTDKVSDPVTTHKSGSISYVYQFNCSSRRSTYRPPYYKAYEYSVLTNLDGWEVTLEHSAHWLRGFLQVVVTNAGSYKYGIIPVNFTEVAGNDGKKWKPDLSICTRANYLDWATQAGFDVSQISASPFNTDTNMSMTVQIQNLYGLYAAFKHKAYIGS